MQLTFSQVGRVWLHYLILASVKGRVRKDWVRH